MSRPVHYSPAVTRFNVKVLYHEAKARGVHMTALINELVRQSLQDSAGWRIAEEETRNEGEQKGKGNYGD